MKNLCPANTYLNNLKDCLKCPFGSISKESSISPSDCSCVENSQLNDTLGQCHCTLTFEYPNTTTGTCVSCGSNYLDIGTQNCTNCPANSICKNENCTDRSDCICDLQCMNGGKCHLESNSGFICNCTSFFTGINCEKSSELGTAIFVLIPFLLLLIIAVIFLVYYMKRKTCSIKWIPTPSS